MKATIASRIEVAGGAAIADTGLASRIAANTTMNTDAATAFAAATFLSLQLGGRSIWRDGTHWGARAGAGLGAATMLAGASWVVWSRVVDGRHHLSDVLTGSVVGAGVATAWYLSLFDFQGERRLAGDHPGRARQALMIGTQGVF